MADTEFILQKDAFGIVLSIDTGINLSSTTDMLLYVRKPDDNLVSIILTDDDITNAPLGIVTYIVEEGLLDQVGNYKFQIVDTSVGRFFPSEVKQFKVKDNA